MDVFFALSGFLITSLLVSEWRRRGAVSLKAFWARRARRLVPGLVVVVLLGIAAFIAFVTPVTERASVVGTPCNDRSRGEVAVVFAAKGYFDQSPTPHRRLHCGRWPSRSS